MWISRNKVYLQKLGMRMGKFCKKCGRLVKNPKATHCSDECLFADIKKSKSLDKLPKGVEAWSEDADPWI